MWDFLLYCVCCTDMQNWILLSCSHEEMVGMFSLFLSLRGWIPAAFLCIENQKVRGGHGLFCQRSACDLQNKMVACSGNWSEELAAQCPDI